MLRSARGYRPDQLTAAPRHFAGLPTVTLKDPARIAAGLDAVTRGMDFSDALHLTAAVGCDADGVGDVEVRLA